MFIEYYLSFAEAFDKRGRTLIVKGLRLPRTFQTD